MAMPRQLQESYLTGKVAARIRWNTGGDFTRCVKQATRHGMQPGVGKGACNTLHKLATGVYPGDRRNAGKRVGRSSGKLGGKRS